MSELVRLELSLEVRSWGLTVVAVGIVIIIAVAAAPTVAGGRTVASLVLGEDRLA